MSLERSPLAAEATGTHSEAGESNFMRAVRSGDLDTFNRLLDAKECDVNEVDSNGDTIAMLAMVEAGTNKSSSTCQEILRKILNTQGVDLDKSNNAGETLFSMAVTYEIAVQFLLKRRVDFEKSNKNGETPLMKAFSSPAIVDMLLETKEVNVNAVDIMRESVLFKAINGGSEISVIRALLNAGAKVNLRNKYGESALDVAESSGMYEEILPELRAKSRVELTNAARTTGGGSFGRAGASAAGAGAGSAHAAPKARGLRPFTASVTASAAVRPVPAPAVAGAGAGSAHAAPRARGLRPFTASVTASAAVRPVPAPAVAGAGAGAGSAHAAPRASGLRPFTARVTASAAVRPIPAPAVAGADAGAGSAIASTYSKLRRFTARESVEGADVRKDAAIVGQHTRTTHANTRGGRSGK